MSKKKILVCSEASYLHSGFGTYANELLTRLHATDKYELAEFASYGIVNDERDKDIKWRYYANFIKPDDPRMGAYSQFELNQFGMWRFERVALDFKPDIVIGYRDYWMDSFVNESPLRPYFHWIISPTVDSAPQKESWISTYMDADGVMPYSDYGSMVLEKEGFGKINLHKSNMPGVDINVFTPIEDFREKRKEFGLPPDINIIGTVMRNQKRKYYDDLIKSFEGFLQYCLDNGQKELANKTYLYIHTSYPDMNGWDIPRILKETSISHKIIFTYMCKRCKQPFCSFFQDGRTVCSHCKQVSAMMPSVGEGISREQLATIYNTFDLYVQYANCEGLGMPAVEAASCGVPIMEVNYSAMESVLKVLDGIPIDKTMYRELESHSYRAQPDNEDFIQKLYKFFTVSDNSPENKMKRRQLTRKLVEENFSWDANAKKWENYLDSVVLKDKQGKWDSPLNLYNPATQMPENMTNLQFVRWVINDVWGKPDKVHSLMALQMLRDLNFGVVSQGGKLQPIERDQIFRSMLKRVENNNLCERGRCGLIPLTQDDYINYANIKERANEASK